jgi:outer membrane murein-binding lipoprotein Lpp
MYEPYGEEKKGLNLKERFNQFKQRLKEKLKSMNIDPENFQFNKLTIVFVALAMLLLVGGTTGYISYTSKINTLQNNNLVLEKQRDALEVEKSDLLTQLSTCNSEINIMQSEVDGLKNQLTQVTFNYETTESDLQICNEDKLTLSSDLNMLNEDLENKEKQYDALEERYDNLGEDLLQLECHYAKNICGRMEYYFIDDREVFCCLKDDPEFCEEDPMGMDIRTIDC